MAATEFTFLTVDGHGRPLEPGSRASIRSRCMKGVNVRQDSRRSKRKARKNQEEISAIRRGEESIITQRPDSAFSQSGYCGLLVRSLQVRTDELGFDSSRLPSGVLRSVVKYNALLDAAYPLEIYLETTDTRGHRMTDDLTLLNGNKILLESIFLATHAVDDLCSGNTLSLRSQRLLCTILSSLSNNLHNTSTQQSYSTILVILILLFAAESFQDFDAVATHLDGLRSLLELREMKPVPFDSKLLFKIQQVDHCAFLSTTQTHRNLFASLARQTLQALSNHANRYQASKARNFLSWPDFQSQVSTSQTYLIGLGSSHLPVVSEGLRLGMLAFLSTLSRSPVRKPHLPIFISQLEECCLLMQQEQDCYRPLLLWLMLMGYISTVDPSSSISSLVWRYIVEPDLPWQTARGMISELPWIETIHDEPGERNLRHLQARMGDIARQC